MERNNHIHWHTQYDSRDNMRVHSSLPNRGLIDGSQAKRRGQTIWGRQRNHWVPSKLIVSSNSWTFLNSWDYDYDSFFQEQTLRTKTDSYSSLASNAENNAFKTGKLMTEKSIVFAAPPRALLKSKTLSDNRINTCGQLPGEKEMNFTPIISALLDRQIFGIF